MKTCLISILLASICAASVQAADKIGNGGGVWVCEGPQHEIFDIMFMDVFEARREYQLTLPEVQVPVSEVVQQQKEWLNSELSMGSKINSHIQYVEKNVTWIEDIINMIPDAANKISPHPSSCRQGEWKAVQLVNYTDDDRVLVRRELFVSTLMTDLERAAVYLHEGLYSYLRTEYGDTNSVRARALVGILLSNLETPEKVSRIEKVLGQTVEPPPPENTGKGWMCGMKPGQTSALYVSEALTEIKARQDVIEICKKGENHFPEIPGVPGIPGLPDMSQCKESKIFCEPILSSEKKKTCELKNFFGDKTYVGSGRTSLEAQKETIAQCMVFESRESSCYSSKITCR